IVLHHALGGLYKDVQMPVLIVKSIGEAADPLWPCLPYDDPVAVGRDLSIAIDICEFQITRLGPWVPFGRIFTRLPDTCHLVVVDDAERMADKPLVADIALF